MSDRRANAAEPSMEDILASIRRIIDEEDAHDREGGSSAHVRALEDTSDDVLSLDDQVDEETAEETMFPERRSALWSRATGREQIEETGSAAASKDLFARAQDSLEHSRDEAHRTIDALTDGEARRSDQEALDAVGANIVELTERAERSGGEAEVFELTDAVERAEAEADEVLSLSTPAEPEWVTVDRDHSATKDDNPDSDEAFFSAFDSAPSSRSDIAPRSEEWQREAASALSESESVADEDVLELGKSDDQTLDLTDRFGEEDGESDAMNSPFDLDDPLGQVANQDDESSSADMIADLVEDEERREEAAALVEHEAQETVEDADAAISNLVESAGDSVSDASEALSDDLAVDEKMPVWDDGPADHDKATGDSAEDLQSVYESEPEASSSAEDSSFDGAHDGQAVAEETQPDPEADSAFQNENSAVDTRHDTAIGADERPLAIEPEAHATETRYDTEPTDERTETYFETDFETASGETASGETAPDETDSPDAADAFETPEPASDEAAAFLSDQSETTIDDNPEIVRDYNPEDVYHDEPPELDGDYRESLEGALTGGAIGAAVAAAAAGAKESPTEDEEPPIEQRYAALDTDEGERELTQARSHDYAQTGSADPSALVSMTSEEMSARALASLADAEGVATRQVYGALRITEDRASDSIEGVVRELLRPMLREWLDDNLPGMVEGMVRAEVERISARAKRFRTTTDD